MRRRKSKRLLFVLIALLVVFTLLFGGCSEKIDVMKIDNDIRQYISNECSKGRCDGEFYTKRLDARLQETRCRTIEDDYENKNCIFEAGIKRKGVIELTKCEILRDDIVSCEVPRPDYFTGYNPLEDE